jgi:hypothetical protein
MVSVEIGIQAAMFVRIHFEHDPELLEIILARGASRRLAGTSERWQQDCCEDADDGYDNKKFN